MKSKRLHLLPKWKAIPFPRWEQIVLKIITRREKKGHLWCCFCIAVALIWRCSSAAVTEVKSLAGCSLTRPAAASKPGWAPDYPEMSGGWCNGCWWWEIMAVCSFQATLCSEISFWKSLFRSQTFWVFRNIQAHINTLFAGKNTFEPVWVSVVTKVTGSLCCCHDTKPGEIKMEKIQSYLWFWYHLGYLVLLWW